MGLVRSFVLSLWRLPFEIARDLFGPDDFDEFIADQRRRFLEMTEGE